MAWTQQQQQQHELQHTLPTTAKSARRSALCFSTRTGGSSSDGRMERSRPERAPRVNPSRRAPWYVDSMRCLLWPLSLTLAALCFAACSSETQPVQPADQGQACKEAADCESICVVACDGGTSGTCGRPTAENCNITCKLDTAGEAVDIPCQ